MVILRVKSLVQPGLGPLVRRWMRQPKFECLGWQSTTPGFSPLPISNQNCWLHVKVAMAVSSQKLGNSHAAWSFSNKVCWMRTSCPGQEPNGTTQFWVSVLGGSLPLLAYLFCLIFWVSQIKCLNATHSAAFGNLFQIWQMGCSPSCLNFQSSVFSRPHNSRRPVTFGAPTNDHGALESSLLFCYSLTCNGLGDLSCPFF